MEWRGPCHRGFSKASAIWAAILAVNPPFCGSVRMAESLFWRAVYGLLTPGPGWVWRPPTLP